MKILHIITGLGDGGAELTLYKICKYDTSNIHIVISLKDKGKYFSLLNKLGIKVFCLNMNLFSFYKIFFLSKKIGNLKEKILDKTYINFEIIENDSEINVFFDNKTLNLVGWQTKDPYQNINVTYLSSIKINQLVDKNLFILPAQN